VSATLAPAVTSGPWPVGFDHLLSCCLLSCDAGMLGGRGRPFSLGECQLLLPYLSKEHCAALAVATALIIHTAPLKTHCFGPVGTLQPLLFQIPCHVRQHALSLFVPASSKVELWCIGYRIGACFVSVSSRVELWCIGYRIGAIQPHLLACLITGFVCCEAWDRPCLLPARNSCCPSGSNTLHLGCNS
jgi:hypothetical protein